MFKMVAEEALPGESLKYECRRGESLLSIDFAARVVKINGAAIGVSPREFSVLVQLFEQQGSVVTLEMFFERHYAEAKSLPTHELFKIFVHLLRKEMGPFQNCIKLVWGRGYYWEVRPQLRVALPPAPNRQKGRVTSPYGDVLTFSSLPEMGSDVRWIVRRKVEVMLLIEADILSLQEALTWYHISPAEYLSWCRQFKKYQDGGMRVTHLPYYLGNERRHAKIS